MGGHPGKRGRAVVINTDTAAQASGELEEWEVEFEREGSPTSTCTHVNPAEHESIIVDLYAADIRSDEERNIRATKPFIHQIRLHGPQGEVVRVWALFDDGAMREAMSTKVFERVKHRLSPTSPSQIFLRMANGSIVKSLGTWEGEIEVEGVRVYGSFKIFNSRGNWDFLFGKRLLTAFKAIHDYDKDEVTVQGTGGLMVLQNQIDIMKNRHELITPHAPPVCVVTEDCDQAEDDEPTADIDLDALRGDDANLFTRMADPYKPERVNEILRLVTIRTDLSEEQNIKVRELISSFTDVFALSVHEVRLVKDVVHRLNIHPNAVFSTKVHQRPFTLPQQQYLHTNMDTMLKAGVIAACKPEEVKCVSSTTLAQKAHQGKGLMLTELQHRINDECITHGFEPKFDLPPRTDAMPDERDNTQEPKWRICQNFAQVNKVTKVAPMPQGDIRSKQQRLSGHRWVSGFDFASGFYAIEVALESRPYMAFYVEGHGYFWYKCLLFGLTGAPSTFASLTSKHMHELLTDGTMELFVDDGGAAADTFNEMMDKLRRIFTRIREWGLSLSASKSEFFMTKMVFAGATVGPNGVQPDLKKLTAIVNWKIPENATALAGFLGLTGWFRNLIPAYARKEKLLHDLLSEVELP